MSAWAIKAPIPSIVIFILLTFAGILGFKKLGINQFPDVDIPVVTVTVSDPGAAPAELETQVTRIVENAVATVGDVTHIMSTTSGGPMLTYTVHAQGRNAAELSWFSDNEVAKTLLTVKGVGQVKRLGGVDREIQIVLRPDRLAAYGITAAEISKQVKAINVNVPGGKATVGHMEQSIRTLGSARTVEDLRALQIALHDGRWVRLADLGAVEDLYADPTQDAFVDGERVVAFQVMRAIGSSSVDVAKRVDKAVTKLVEENKGTEIKLFNSTVDFTIESYNASIEALVLGAALAVIVVFCFLRDWRATVISAVAMPLSVIPTFIFMSWLGFSLNLITLLGLSLVVGILVDDAIVEVENIVRHMRMGKTPFQAALEAADEIGLAVVATTFAIVAVFIPVSFMSGVPGQFFKQFGISVAVAVLFSLLVARLLTPVMGAYFLKAHHEEHRESRVMNAYLKLVRWGLAHRKLAILSGVLLFVASIALAPLLPKSFVPASDRSRSTINFELPPGTPLEATSGAAERARQLIVRHPEVTNVLAVIGGGAQLDALGTSSTAEVRAGTLTVKMVPLHKRKISQREFEKLLEKDLRQIPGFRFRFGGGEAGEVLDVILVSDNAAVLEKTAEKVEREMRTVKGVGNPA